MIDFYLTDTKDLGEEELHEVSRQTLESWEQMPNLFVKEIPDLKDKLEVVFALNYTSSLMSRLTEKDLKTYMEMYEIPLNVRIKLNDWIKEDNYTDYSPILILHYIRCNRQFLYHKNIYGDGIEDIVKLTQENRIRGGNGKHSR